MTVHVPATLQSLGDSLESEARQVAVLLLDAGMRIHDDWLAERMFRGSRLLADACNEWARGVEGRQSEHPAA
jgi:hypothetical protein